MTTPYVKELHLRRRKGRRLSFSLSVGEETITFFMSPERAKSFAQALLSQANKALEK